MWPDWVSNLRPEALESDALCGPGMKPLSLPVLMMLLTPGLEHVNSEGLDPHVYLCSLFKVYDLQVRNF